MKTSLWDDNHKGCPWFNEGICKGQIYYNGHVNDPRYERCDSETCPILFWVDVYDSVKGVRF